MILEMITSGYKTTWHLCESVISSLFMVRLFLEIMGCTYTLDLKVAHSLTSNYFMRSFSILASVLANTFLPLPNPRAHHGFIIKEDPTSSELLILRQVKPLG